MADYKLETGAGDHFTRVAERAKAKAVSTEIQVALYKAINAPRGMETRKYGVEFDFNGITCLVDKDTNLDWLYRDYCNAHTMTWKQVGPDCLEAYESEVQAELERRNKAEELRQEEQRAIWKAKEDAERKLFEEKVKGIKMKIRDRKGFNEWKANQKDVSGYGNAIFEYAENWAKLMQKEFTERNIEKPDVACMIAHADNCSKELNFLGITGFMYGAAVAILAAHWKYGEALRKWHNKEYGQENTKGVVNPAMLTINI